MKIEYGYNQLAMIMCNECSEESTSCKYKTLLSMAVIADTLEV